MKVLLVNPPARRFVWTQHPSFPLGPGYIAAVLGQDGYETDISDTVWAKTRPQMRSRGSTSSGRPMSTLIGTVPASAPGSRITDEPLTRKPQPISRKNGGWRMSNRRWKVKIYKVTGTTGSPASGSA